MSISLYQISQACERGTHIAAVSTQQGPVVLFQQRDDSTQRSNSAQPDGCHTWQTLRGESYSGPVKSIVGNFVHALEKQFGPTIAIKSLRELKISLPACNATPLPAPQPNRTPSAGTWRRLSSTPVPSLPPAAQKQLSEAGKAVFHLLTIDFYKQDTIHAHPDVENTAQKIRDAVGSVLNVTPVYQDTLTDVEWQAIEKLLYQKLVLVEESSSASINLETGLECLTECIQMIFDVAVEAESIKSIFKSCDDNWDSIAESNKKLRELLSLGSYASDSHFKLQHTDHDALHRVNQTVCEVLDEKKVDFSTFGEDWSYIQPYFCRLFYQVSDRDRRLVTMEEGLACLRRSLIICKTLRDVHLSKHRKLIQRLEQTLTSSKHLISGIDDRELYQMENLINLNVQKYLGMLDKDFLFSHHCDPNKTNQAKLILKVVEQELKSSNQPGPGELKQETLDKDDWTIVKLFIEVRLYNLSHEFYTQKISCGSTPEGQWWIQESAKILADGIKHVFSLRSTASLENVIASRATLQRSVIACLLGRMQIKDLFTLLQQASLFRLSENPDEIEATLYFPEVAFPTHDQVETQVSHLAANPSQHFIYVLRSVFERFAVTFDKKSASKHLAKQFGEDHSLWSTLKCIANARSVLRSAVDQMPEDQRDGYLRTLDLLEQVAILPIRVLSAHAHVLDDKIRHLIHQRLNQETAPHSFNPAALHKVTGENAVVCTKNETAQMEQAKADEQVIDLEYLLKNLRLELKDFPKLQAYLFPEDVSALIPPSPFPNTSISPLAGGEEPLQTPPGSPDFRDTSGPASPPKPEAHKPTSLLSSRPNEEFSFSTFGLPDLGGEEESDEESDTDN